MATYNAKYAYGVIEDHPFKIYQTHRTFKTNGTFSGADINLEDKRNDEGLSFVLRLNELMDIAILRPRKEARRNEGAF